MEERRHYQDTELQALAYYRKKYGADGVEITGSIKAGNSGLFGYAGVADRAYEMSDGYTVYWDDDAGTLADDRQAEEIRKAFDREILQPLIGTLSVPVSVSAYSLNRTNYESYDACVFTEYYDGDLRSFLKAETPAMSDLCIVVEETPGFDHEAWVSSFFAALADDLSGYGTVIVKKNGTGTETEQWAGPQDPDVTAKASLDFDGEVSWYRQVYIEVIDGVEIMSDKADFVLEPGDIRFEQAGTCAEVQGLLDNIYEALPVDAEENRNGGYRVHDQRHESRTVLDDPETPYYRLVLSERVQEALDSDGRLSVYVRTVQNDPPLMVHYGWGRPSWQAYKVCREAGRAEYHSLHPDNLYWFGTVHYEAYEEE